MFVKRIIVICLLNILLFLLNNTGHQWRKSGG